MKNATEVHFHQRLIKYAGLNDTTKRLQAMRIVANDRTTTRKHTPKMSGKR